MSKEYIMVVNEAVANAMAHLFGNIITFVEVQPLEGNSLRSDLEDRILLCSPKRKEESNVE